MRRDRLEEAEEAADDGGTEPVGLVDNEGPAAALPKAPRPLGPGDHLVLANHVGLLPRAELLVELHGWFGCS